MTDDRSTESPELEHDEFHSSLEVDDSSGWRVFIVPGILLLFLIGAVLFIVLSPEDDTPDPRIAGHFKNEAAAVAQPAATPQEPAPIAAPVNMAEPANTADGGNVQQ
jgi:hypothetical protein